MVEVDLGVPGFAWQSTLGRGGSGTVYQALDEAHGRQVAVKLLHTAIDDAGRRRFDRERQTMGSLGSHPNIVTVLTSGFTTHDLPYLVMELMPGGSLADRLRQGPLDVDEVVNIGRQLADALGAAHRAGIIHCDVKPANVLLRDDGHPVLTDFGIASVVGDQTTRVTVSATPSFAAPELLQGRDSDQRSDIYSLAATLFACLEGHPPYGNTSETMLGVLYQIINDPVPTASRSDISQTVSDALHRAMAKDPDDRQPTMADFAAELTGTIGLAPTPTSPTPTTTSAAPTHSPTSSPASSLADEPSRLESPVPTNETPPARSRRWREARIIGAAAAGAILIGVAVTALTGGSKQVDVPEVAGLALADARRSVEDVGLLVEHGPACDSAIARSAIPAAGAGVEPGSTITIEVDPCIVPDFVGLRLQEAIDLILTIDGLSIAWENYCDDLVLGQDPVAGSAVDFDSTVAIELRAC